MHEPGGRDTSTYMRTSMPAACHFGSCPRLACCACLFLTWHGMLPIRRSESCYEDIATCSNGYLAHFDAHDFETRLGEDVNSIARDHVTWYPMLSPSRSANTEQAIRGSGCSTAIHSLYTALALHHGFLIELSLLDRVVKTKEIHSPDKAFNDNAFQPAFHDAALPFLCSNRMHLLALVNTWLITKSTLSP